MNWAYLRPRHCRLGWRDWFFKRRLLRGWAPCGAGTWAELRICGFTFWRRSFD